MATTSPVFGSDSPGQFNELHPFERKLIERMCRGSCPHCKGLLAPALNGVVCLGCECGWKLVPDTEAT